MKDQLSKWERDYRYFNGDHWNIKEDETLTKRAQRIVVNMVQSSVLSIVPFLVRNNPKIILKPTRPEFVDGAKRKENLINHVWRKHDMLKQFKRAIQDGAVCGTGIIKVGWEFQSKELPTTEQGLINYIDYVEIDSPFIRRIAPPKLLVDPQASESDLSTARWVAEIFFNTYQDVIHNPEYNHEVIKD
jgi:hypothetical protein